MTQLNETTRIPLRPDAIRLTHKVLALADTVPPLVLTRVLAIILLVMAYQSPAERVGDTNAGPSVQTLTPPPSPRLSRSQGKRHSRKLGRSTSMALHENRPGPKTGTPPPAPPTDPTPSPTDRTAPDPGTDPVSGCVNRARCAAL